MIRRKLIRAGIFLAGFGFIAGSTLFAFAWFTVSIPDANAYVNSQSTIIQYSRDWSNWFTEPTNLATCQDTNEFT